MRISFCTGGRTSESTALRTQYRSWSRGFAERLRATLSPNRSRKLRNGRKNNPLFAPIFRNEREEVQIEKNKICLKFKTQ